MVFSKLMALWKFWKYESGVTTKSAKWELGKTEPTASAIIAIAKYFNETTDYILGLEN